MIQQLKLKTEMNIGKLAHASRKLDTDRKQQMRPNFVQRSISLRYVIDLSRFFLLDILFLLIQYLLQRRAF